MMFHLQQVVRQGFERFQPYFALKDIILPVYLYLLDFVLIPFFASRFLALYLYTGSYLHQTICARYAHLVYVGLFAVKYLGLELYHWLVRVHNDIRDTTLLEGAQLANR